MESGDEWYSVLSSVVSALFYRTPALDLVDPLSLPLLIRSFG